MKNSFFSFTFLDFWHLKYYTRWNEKEEEKQVDERVISKEKEEDIYICKEKERFLEKLMIPKSNLRKNKKQEH
jgi:hypothetical protein